ncbi:hypothetical protein [Ensifer sp. YR511]|uniref:hypothetical protein n=1 Tax=Ensifer sp. YR511 TaxID=1855294 RepID=UPI00087DFFAA|nr:hypothetical protein [Ensifer sp. YR511]SDN02123.1 hypothetical protein SAMN05216328_1172 [Ensifer sp. YR511]
MSTPAEFDPFSIKNLRPGLQECLRLFVSALYTNTQDELSRKSTEELLDAIGRPTTPEDQNALLLLANANVRDLESSRDVLFERYNSTIGRAFETIKAVQEALGAELDERLSKEEKARFEALSQNAVNDLSPLVKEASPSVRWGLAAASSVVLGGSLGVILNSAENAYKIRAPTTNIMWGLEILTVALSPTSDPKQFWEAFVMRFGVSVATQIIACIELFFTVEDKPWKSAAIILPNLVILFGHVIYPIVRGYVTRALDQRRAKITAPAVRQDVVASAFFERIGDALTATLEEMEAKEKIFHPDNKTRAKFAGAKGGIASLRDAINLYRTQTSQSRSTDGAADRALKVPSVIYAHSVAILQVISALGNVKTLGDNSVFFVLILSLTWESFFNPSHSPEFMATRIMRYSAGMFISFFTAGIPLLKYGRNVFDESPSLTRNMAILTAILNLTVAVHFIPAFGLLIKGFSALTKYGRGAGSQLQASEQSNPFSETVRLLVDCESDDDIFEIRPADVDPKGAWLEVLAMMEERRCKDKKTEVQEGLEGQQEEKLLNFFDVMAIYEATGDTKTATKDVLSVFDAFLDPACSLDDVALSLKKLGLERC